ncbi:MauE/DoxX family redox-associated membrane protein [Parapedobacter koreensis]|uniref:Methylamine utilisation protein MauE domain-containing protein n=1 Tax=Parapedobacter koreensis TaxID=332977 RepID=A0A1H7K1U9_9SPHI|nr:MauE/DoxX family redox-associated membrane protein [Parapedobacter koreensis]SEK80798.1 hypothetical protein SAMN05421740_102754 [Parapedobacter koreensis]
MITIRKHIALLPISVIRLSLVVLWLPVAAEKLWDLQKFHGTLLRQPFPAWWADTLYWPLPLLELASAVLIAWPDSRRRVHHGMWLSALLMLGFTLFILFGVLGWYEKRPCGCGSVISGLSWEGHLWFNAAFLLLSVFGALLTRPKHLAGHPHRRYRKALRLFRRRHIARQLYRCRAVAIRLRFPRKMAVFRRRA